MGGCALSQLAGVPEYRGCGRNLGTSEGGRHHHGQPAASERMVTIYT